MYFYLWINKINYLFFRTDSSHISKHIFCVCKINSEFFRTVSHHLSLCCYVSLLFCRIYCRPTNKDDSSSFSSTISCPWHRCRHNAGEMLNTPFNPHIAAIMADVSWINRSWYPCRVCFPQLAPLLIPPPWIFYYGFCSCLRFGLTYITLINKGWSAPWMNHYGISPATEPTRSNWESSIPASVLPSA